MHRDCSFGQRQVREEGAIEDRRDPVIYWPHQEPAVLALDSFSIHIDAVDATFQ
ncbi:hypothetical protein JVT61DRAFT_12183 [Boletus reticuloceps]|uniref:Uncharacterized protein n=1 Tax=Boletus reticuloceps TaxID=495285 RepID=A0A8I2YE41_9AGAM|nr:hypothetical protein JVT61DRAFT_12183 [Boletus reticuloceps]